MADDEIKRATRAMALRKAKAQADKAEAEAKRAQARLTAATKRKEKADDSDYLGTGRKPLKRSRALGDRICRRLEQGMSLRKACAGEIDSAAVLRWVRDSSDFAQQYARSREIGWLGKTDRILELADEAHEAALDPDFGQQRIAACRFEVDTLKWVLAKMLPKIYGEKVGVQVLSTPGSNAPSDAASVPALPNDDEERIIASIAERQAHLMRIQAAEEAEVENG